MSSNHRIIDFSAAAKTIKRWMLHKKNVPVFLWLHREKSKDQMSSEGFWASTMTNPSLGASDTNCHLGGPEQISTVIIPIE